MNMSWLFNTIIGIDLECLKYVFKSVHAISSSVSKKNRHEKAIRNIIGVFRITNKNYPVVNPEKSKTC